MTLKDIKSEARKKLALNMHQAIVLYTVELTVFITLIALVVMSSVCLGVNSPAAIVMICYGCLLGIIALVGIGMLNFAMVDFYLASYRCKPYNVRRLGDTLARSNITKIFLLSIKRTLLALLLLLCLIVPGVIYLIRTSMANYLLIANPKMKSSVALSASNKVMSGKTGAYFALCMSLIGWYLLGILTLGLGFIFILPYTNLIKAVYYKRNLQGDKTVYNVEVQPVSPPYGQPQPVSANGGAVVNAENAAQQRVVEPVQSDEPTAPMDTLGDEDLMNMSEAMRDLAGGVEEPFVAEVPLVMPKKNKTPDRIDPEPIAAAPQAVEPIVKLDQTESSHSIDGTDLVATERTLTTKELEASKTSHEQILADMYTPSAKKPDIDYFAGSAKQRADDFVTQEAEFTESKSVVSPIADRPAAAFADDFGTDEPVISDSDFDAFLREFDSKSERLDTEPVSVNTESSAPTAVAKPSNAEKPKLESVPSDTRRAERRAPDRTERVRKATERMSAGGAQQPNIGNQSLADRAERMRREREQRLNNLNKKQ